MAGVFPLKVLIV